MWKWGWGQFWGWLGWLGKILLNWAMQNPVLVFFAVMAILRSFGTTVQTGWSGVLFSFGRAQKVLEPGFHPLIPIFQKVRQTPVRSITLNLPKQRITTSDGLVYDVDANIVFRVEDPIVALTAVDDITQGIINVVPMILMELLHEKTQSELSERQLLDTEFALRSGQRLKRWGLVIETAGMATIAPTPETAKITQLRARVTERAKIYGLEPSSVALAMVSAGHAPRGRSSAKYHRRKRTTKSKPEMILSELLRGDPHSV
jgi:regulator of protease activity HflC (stomatin/prohibitin superfamily)